MPSTTVSAPLAQPGHRSDPTTSTDWVVNKINEFWKHIDKAREEPGSVTPPTEPPEQYVDRPTLIQRIKEAVPGLKDKSYDLTLDVIRNLKDAFGSAVEIAIGAGITIAKQSGYVIDVIKPEDSDFDYDFTDFAGLARDLVTTAAVTFDRLHDNYVAPALIKASQQAAQEIIYRLLVQTKEMVPAILKIHEEATRQGHKPFTKPYEIPKDEPKTDSKITPFDWDEANKRARDKMNEKYEKSLVPVSPLEINLPMKSKAVNLAREHVIMLHALRDLLKSYPTGSEVSKGITKGLLDYVAKSYLYGAAVGGIGKIV